MEKSTKRAVVLPESESFNNQQLLKDCGLIPLFLHKNYGFESVILTVNADNYTYLDTYAKGLKIEYLKTGSVEEKIEYIKKEAKSIDLLILYGAYEVYSFFAPLYKYLNPNGKIYLALDANSVWMDRIDFNSTNYVSLLNSCDVIATSCRILQRHLNEKWPWWKIEYISNGYFDYVGDKKIPDISQKENIILTVARIGTPVKRTDILLESFSRIHNEIPDWKLKIVGNIAPEFNAYIDEFFRNNPELKEKVIFTGPIIDKLELFNLYKKSKVFALPSDSEGGTPNVISEALFNGNAIAITKIDAHEEATDNNKCGTCSEINDVDGFAQNLLSLCKNESLNEYCIHAYHYAKRYFDMSKNVDRIYEMLFGGSLWEE